MGSPLIETNVVFDEKILGVEFLPLPAQFPDYLVNLNSEIPNYRLKMIMDKILGPSRVEGFGVTVDESVPPLVKVAPGLLMFSSYFVRLTQEASFTTNGIPSIIYAKVTTSKLTSDTDPDIVNVNPPLASVSLPGPNQYRYTVQLICGVVLPIDTSTTFHAKVCDVLGDLTITNQLPLITKGLGSIDFTDVKDVNYTSKQGTRNPSWKVGVGVFNGGAGAGVALANPDPPATVANLRVTDVVPDSLLPFLQTDANLSFCAKRGLATHQALVALKWGHDNVPGTPGSGGIFTLSLATTEGCLVGYRLWVPKVSKDFVITVSHVTGTSTTDVTLTNPDGTTPSYSDLGGVGAQTGLIVHPDAKYYEVVAVPVDAGDVEQLVFRAEDRLSYPVATDVVLQQAMIRLNLGYRYKIFVRSVNVTASAFTELAAGSYTKAAPYVSPVSYMGDGKPFLVKLADISSTGAQVTTTGQNNGFRVTIVGWDLATAFEIVYELGNADFNGDSTQRVVAFHRQVDIVTSNPGTYDVKVRPLMGGQVAAGYIQTTGVAGAIFGAAEDIAIQKDDPALILKDVNGNNLGRIGGSLTPSEDPRLLLQLYDPPSQAWSTMLDARGDKTYLDVPNKDLYNKGKKVATEEYVQARIKTGNFVISSTIPTATLTAGGQTVFFPNGPFLVPDNAILRGVRMMITTDAYDGLFQSYSWSASFAFTGNNCLVVPRIDFTLFAGDLYRELVIEAWEPKDSELVKTSAFSSNIQQNYAITPPQVVTIHLMMLFGY